MARIIEILVILILPACIGFFFGTRNIKTDDETAYLLGTFIGKYERLSSDKITITSSGRFIKGRSRDGQNMFFYVSDKGRYGYLTFRR